MIQEAFQYPTRLGRQGARRAGRLLFMRLSPAQVPAPFWTKAGEGSKKDEGAVYGRLRPKSYFLLRPPRLPSMLRFRSAIFPSEEERNCLSLSSKDWSPEGGRG